MIGAVLGPQEKLPQLTGADPAEAARRLHQRIEDAAMTVWCQQLQRLQRDRAPHDDGDNEKPAAGVGEAERQSQQRKCGETLKLREGKHGAGLDRGQRRVDDDGERQPARNSGYPLNHRR